MDWRQCTVDAAGRRSRTGKSSFSRTLVSAEVLSTLAPLRCATRAVSVSKLAVQDATRPAVQDATRLTSSAADLEANLLRLADQLRSTYADLRHRTHELRRRLRFHVVTALGGVRKTFDGGMADPFGDVRERSLAPLVADCYQTMSDIERTVKQLTFTSASEVVARKVNAAIICYVYCNNTFVNSVVRRPNNRRIVLLSCYCTCDRVLVAIGGF